MWLFMTEGFFSIVKDEKKPGTLVIRARVKDDLDNLRATYMPTLGPTTDKEGSDYPYRARASQADVALGLYNAAMGIQYDNFKNAVARQRGHGKYYRALTRIWGVMSELGMNKWWTREQRRVEKDLPYLDSHGPEGYGPPDEVFNGQVVQRGKRGNPRRRPKKD